MKRGTAFHLFGEIHRGREVVYSIFPKFMAWGMKGFNFIDICIIRHYYMRYFTSLVSYSCNKLCLWLDFFNSGSSPSKLQG